MIELLPSFSPPDIADIGRRAYTHPRPRVDNFESYTHSSPLVIWSSSMDDVYNGRCSEVASRILDCEEHVSRRGLREVLQRCNTDNIHGEPEHHRMQLSLLALFLTALRRSLVSCKAVRKDSSMDIGWPTHVRHVAHVTFDRFNGFLGLPVEFEVEIPRRVPSASASIFGVSAESMQCSYDRKGNSVPTILLLIQEKLYRQGGLQVEGIFRINAENSHEEEVRQQLNKGIVPDGVDLHCLAGLIKAWFRELPTGVLDSLAPEEVMQCSTERQYLELMTELPSTEAALLDWTVNLMADVAQDEDSNKMNAHNIAMVFAPNMTQMADPMTALMHAVQVMNFLKTLILKTLREREEAVLDPRPVYGCARSRFDDDFDADSGSPFLSGYSKHDNLEGDDSIQEAFMPPCNSPNKIGSFDDFSRDEFDEILFFDFDQKIYVGEPTYQGGSISFNDLLLNKDLEGVEAKSREYELLFLDNGRDQVMCQGMKIIDQPNVNLRYKTLDDHRRFKEPGIQCGSMVSR